jgi:hypothetical protein
MDARSSSSPTVRGGIAGVAVDAGSGPGVVWPVFVFFLLFFSSFFSSASCYSCDDDARKELWRVVDVGAVSPCAW